MPAEHGFRLLNCALPVLRLLGVKSVSINFDSTDGNGGDLEAPRYKSLPPNADPEGLSSLLQAGTWHVLPAEWGITNLSGTLTVDVLASACWLEVRWLDEVDRLPLAAEAPPPPNAHDLAAFVKGVCRDRDGHLVLADRLEELFGPCCTASAFRASVPEPPTCEAGHYLVGEPLVWRWLDRGVMLYLSHVRRWVDPASASVVVGFAFGLLHRRQGEQARRWQRWLHGEPDEAMRLADELGFDPTL
jgi:hypothetical protein